MIATDLSLSAFEKILEAQGLTAGLLYLNQRVPYRYTSVYELDRDRLLRVAFVDKQGGHGMEFAEVPFKNSFCEIAARDGSLSTADTSTDSRLQGNPYVSTVASYVGLPLTLRQGELVGTFCHYDSIGQPVDDQEFAFLEEAVRLLSMYCMQPGRPLGPAMAI